MKVELVVCPRQLDGPGEVTLTWIAEHATTLLLSGAGRVEGLDKFTLQVHETTTFVLTAFDAARGRVGCDQRTVAVGERAPAGLIVPWWGAGREPPPGWAICDGENGTPDLRGRFVRGAGGAVSPHELGERGSHGHALDLTGIGRLTSLPSGKHSHSMERPRTRTYNRDTRGPSSIELNGGAAAGDDWVDAGEHAHDLELTLPAGPFSDAPDPRPLWHALHYLMKR